MNLEYLYSFFPLFSGGLVALSIMFKIHKRSVSTFIYLLSQASVLHLISYGYIEWAIVLTLITMFVLLLRAMMKEDSDECMIKRRVNVKKV